MQVLKNIEYLVKNYGIIIIPIMGIKFLRDEKE